MQRNISGYMGKNLWDYTVLSATVFKINYKCKILLLDLLLITSAGDVIYFSLSICLSLKVRDMRKG